jgi:glycosyltransferase involved in cell wall biosynthesis
MKMLFLDQSGELGGAELSLLDIAKYFRKKSMVLLFADGPYKQLLEQEKIWVRTLSNKKVINIRKDSNILSILGNLTRILPLLVAVTALSKRCEIIYANTPKALVIGALASFISQRKLVFHLRDILSADHFSLINSQLIIWLSNRFAQKVITNSFATQAAFIQAGGNPNITEVIYNGFDSGSYQVNANLTLKIRQNLNAKDSFLVGHFSRLGTWKGQHILLEALSYCDANIKAIIVGGPLFGVEEYETHLHEMVIQLGLQERVKFLGFRSDIPLLMSACDLITHTSIAPEPFGRVIVEAMLCGKPVIAANAGGATEIIDHNHTGWLTPPGDAKQLANMIGKCHGAAEQTFAVAQKGQKAAIQRFGLPSMHQKIDQLLQEVLNN